jgi:hypothetical protein
VKGSIERVRAVIAGQTPDSAPMFDLLRNDAVISHFAGETLTVENAPEVVYAAYEPAIDATRPNVGLPKHESTETLPDGRSVRRFRWTEWIEHVTYADTAAYAAAKREVIDTYDPAWSDEKQAWVDGYLAGIAAERGRLGEVFFCPGGGCVGLMCIMAEVGVEFFSYALADCPGIIDELMEINTIAAIAWIDRLPPGHGIEMAFCGDDIAYKTGPFMSPAWFAEHHFPRLARINDALHRQGIKVLFHSDGNLNSILDGLVEAGIDGLNPIEVLAGMDVAEIHRRHPHLFMCGGIDVSQLLPLGTPAEVGDAVRRAIDAAEGRIMIGSSTELNNEVPLANFLALRDAVLESTA